MRKITFDDVYHVMKYRAAFIHSTKPPERISKSSLMYQLSTDFYKTVEVEPLLTAQMNGKFGPEFHIVVVKKQINDHDMTFSFMLFSPDSDVVLYEFDVFYIHENDRFDIGAFAYSVNGQNVGLVGRKMDVEVWMIEMELYFQQLLLELPVFRLHQVTKGIRLRQHTLYDKI